MFPYTESYLQISPSKHKKNEQKTQPASSASQYENGLNGNSRQTQSFLLESITQKVAPLDIDNDPLREDLEQYLGDENFDNEIINFNNSMQKYRQTQRQKQENNMDERQRDVKESQGDVIKSKVKKYNRDHGYIERYIPNEEQPQKIQELNVLNGQDMLRISRKWKDLQKRIQILTFQNIELEEKMKRSRTKIQKDYEEMYKSQIQGLQAELLLEKEKSESEKSELQRTIRNYERKLKKLDDDKTRKNDKASSEKNIKPQSQEVSNLKQELQSCHFEINSLNMEVRRLTLLNNQQNFNVNSKIMGYKKQMEEKHQINIAKLQRQIKNQNQKEKQLLSKFERAKHKLIQSQSKFSSLIQIKQQLENKLKYSNEQNKKLQQNVNLSIKECQQLSFNVGRLKNEKQLWLITIDKLQKKTNSYAINIQQLKSQLENAVNSFQQAKNDKQQLQSRIQSMNKERQQALQEMDRLKTELNDQKLQNKQLHNFKKLVTNSLQNVSQQLSMYIPKNFTISNEYFIQMQKNIANLKYFSDSAILSKMSFSKKAFLLNALDDFLGNSSYKTNLVYRYDPLNLTNFHNYFDKKENLLIIIELANGTVIGGFTAYPYNSERTQKPGYGFLFSLTNEKIYRQRAEPKQPVASYDIYFYILGNAQIRIKTQEKKIFSNFGIANSTFDNEYDLRTDFLKVKQSTNNELEFNTYEFYQIRNDLRF